jgi:signal peptidase I
MTHAETKPSRLRAALAVLLPVGLISAAIAAWLLPLMPGLAPFLAGWWILALGLAAMRWRKAWKPALLVFPLALPPLLIALLVNFKAVTVNGPSMSPTFQQGDVLLVDRTHAPLAPLGIYVIEVEGEARPVMVKRLAGMPGQALRVRYDRLFADGVEVHPRLGTPPDTWNTERPFDGRGYLRNERTLGPDEYFFIGDNPPSSRDSRNFGPLGKGAIQGRVVWRLRGSGGFGPP